MTDYGEQQMVPQENTSQENEDRWQADKWQERQQERRDSLDTASNLLTEESLQKLRNNGDKRIAQHIQHLSEFKSLSPEETSFLATAVYNGGNSEFQPIVSELLSDPSRLTNLKNYDLLTTSLEVDSGGNVVLDTSGQVIRASDIASLKENPETSRQSLSELRQTSEWQSVYVKYSERVKSVVDAGFKPPEPPPVRTTPKGPFD